MSRVFKVDYIADPDRGRPLWNAKIYVGIPNEDPTIPSNQIQLTGDIGFPVGQSIPVPQPVRTNKGGVTVYNNSPLDLNAPGQQYAIAIYDRNDNLIYNFPQVDGSVAMNTTSQEEVTGLTIWPEVGEAVIGQTIPAGTDAIRYPFNGRSTLFTLEPPVAVTGVITDITVNTNGIGSLEVDNSDVYALQEYNVYIASNAGDSQLAGGAIWPLSSQDSAQVGDIGLTNINFLRDSGGVAVYETSETVNGDITALDLNQGTATVGGVDVFLGSEKFNTVTKSHQYGLKPNNLSKDYTDNITALLQLGGVIVIQPGQYNFNPTTFADIPSNTVIFAYGVEFIDSSATSETAIRTAIDSENITVIGLKTTGYSRPFVHYFSTNCKRIDCISVDARDTGFVNQGSRATECYDIRCKSINPTIHCFANAQSTLDAALPIDERYPIITYRVNCYGEDAEQMFCDAHSNSENGHSYIIGCSSKNCGTLGKNSFGDCTWRDFTFTKEVGAPAAIGYIMQVGAPDSTRDSLCTVDNLTLNLAVDEPIFIYLGDYIIQNVKVNSLAAIGLFFNISRKEIKRGIAKHFEINAAASASPGTGMIFTPVSNWDGTAIGDINLEFEDFDFKETVLDITNPLILLNNVNSTSSNSSIKIKGFKVDTSAGEIFCQTANMNINRIDFDNNTSKSNLLRVLHTATSGEIIKNLGHFKNTNILRTSRTPSTVERSDEYGNFPRLYFNPESTGDSSGTSTVLIADFEAGGNYSVEITTDLSSSGNLFQSIATYYIAVARDSSGIQTSVAYGLNEPNINAQFLISGSNINFYTNTATTHKVVVKNLTVRT